VLVGAPELDLGLRMSRLDGGYLGRKVCLKAA
jgi:hypothetical protein